MSVSRREFLALLGMSLAGAALVGVTASAAPRKARRSAADGWRVASVGAPRRGAVPITLQSLTNDESLVVEVCRRGGSRAPVAASRQFDLFLANQGTGTTDTPRDHILAVRALARRLDKLQTVVPAPLLTMDERLHQHAELFETRSPA